MKPEDKNRKDPKIWSEYKTIVESAENHKFQWAKLNRAKFHEESKKVGITKKH